MSENLNIERTLSAVEREAYAGALHDETTKDVVWTIEDANEGRIGAEYLEIIREEASYRGLGELVKF